MIAIWTELGGHHRQNRKKEADTLVEEQRRWCRFIGSKKRKDGSERVCVLRELHGFDSRTNKNSGEKKKESCFWSGEGERWLLRKRVPLRVPDLKQLVRDDLKMRNLR